jgi:urease accessory protein
LEDLNIFTPSDIPQEVLRYKSEPSQMGVGKTGKIGILQLLLEEDDERKKTIIKEKFCRVPLYVQRALYLEESIPSMAYIYIISPSGGILQGDRYRIDITLKKNSYAHITTQSATRVYKMERDFATQMVNIVVDDGCYFEYIPEQVIPFRNSRFYQVVDLNVHENSTMVYSEMIVPGRVASGEVFEYDICYVKTVAKDNFDKLRFTDTFKLEPKKEDLRSFGIMENLDTVSSLYILTKREYVKDIKNEINSIFKNIVIVRGGASVLPDNRGIIVRILGNTASEVRNAIFEILKITRKKILGATFSGIRKA